jgi:nucleophosmin 1
MEFWGVELKSGEPFTCQPGEGRVVHLSQANLGEPKQDNSNERVYIYVKIGGKKLVLGTLNSENVPQQSFDLIFDKEFEISHSSKNSSVHFIGYCASQPFGDESESDDDMLSDEDLPQQIQTQDAAVTKTKTQKAEKAVQPEKVVKQEDSDDSDEDSDGSDDGESGSDSDAPLVGELGSDSDEDDESDDESESEEEETPKAVHVKNKKRPNEAAAKTPLSDKKAKLATPKKSDGKKAEAHVDTPHPKQAAKNAAGNKSNQKSAEGSVKCDSCKRPFKSEFALEAHSKAKHSAGK